MKVLLSGIKRRPILTLIIVLAALVLGISLPGAVAAMTTLPSTTIRALANIGGSGTAGKVAFFTTATDVGSDPNLTWDNTNKRLGIGTATPSRPLHVKGNIALFERNVNSAGFIIERNGADVAGYNRWVFGVDEPTGFVIKTYPYDGATAVDQLVITKDNPSTPANESKIGIGTTSPSARLDVLETNGFSVAVGGTNTGQGTGMLGISDSGNGVEGITHSANGVFGLNMGSGNYGYIGTDGVGVYGQSSSGYGVSGTSSSGYGGHFSGGTTGSMGLGGRTGAYGSGTTYGVRGDSLSGTGVYGFGFSTSAAGVSGENYDTLNLGKLGTSSYGVYGHSTSGWAGYFNGKVNVTGDFTVGGTKNFVTTDPSDPTKDIYYAALEGPEAGTYLRGSAELVDGKVTIDLPQHFTDVTADEGLTVQLTPVGKWLQLYVIEKSTQRIVVGEATGQTGSFDYVINGVRNGYEDYQVIRDAAPVDEGTNSPK